jgi:HSP20 family protein
MPVFDPFTDVARFKSQIDRMFDENSGTSARTQEGSRVLRPAVDIFEDADAVSVHVDLPGIDRASLDVQLTGEELVIRGERKWSAPEGGACVHAERPHGQFHRSFRLGLPLQSDKVEAAYKDGVLRVRLPKAETLKPRKVEVKTDSEG